MPSGDKIVRNLTRGQLYLEEMSLDVGNIFRDFRNKLLEPSRKNTPIIDGGNLGGITVTGSKSAKKKPYFLASRTGLLTAGDAAKAWDTMVTPVLSWTTPNFFRAVDSAQKGDIDGVALEALKAVGLKGAGALASNTTKAGLSNGLNTVKTVVTNPVATTKAIGTATNNMLKSVVTPGSSFWTNPLTKQFATGFALHSGSNGIIRTVSPYKSFGDVLGSTVEEATGWNPNSTVTGSFITESLDPTWYFSPNGVMDKISTISKLPNKSKTLRRWKRLYDRVNGNNDNFLKWNRVMDDIANRYDRMASKAYSQAFRFVRPRLLYKDGININKASDENVLKYLKKYYPEDEFYIENGNIYLKNGTIEDLPKLFLDYSTGLLRDFNFGIKDNSLIEFPRVQYPEGHTINSDLLISYPSQELVNLINNNVKILQEKIPGFIPFGSSQGVSKIGLPYTPHDIDGYITKPSLDSFLKNNPNVPIIKRNNNETITIDLFGKGEPGYVDLNIIDVDNAGKIGNERTEELFRLFFPQAYRKQIEKLSTKQGRESGIVAVNNNGIPLTFDNFVNLNYLTKTIMDSMESDFTNGVKNKHIDRIFRYLISPNQNEVSNALSLTTNMLFLGTGRLLPKLKFGTIDENILLLTKIGYPEGYARIIALDSQRMLNALDYWYLSNRSAMRASNAGTGNSIESQFGTPETLNRNFSKWNPDVSQGGTASGGGINTTIEGPSGHIRHFIGYAQPRVEGLYDGMLAEEAVKLIDNKLGLNTRVIDTSDPVAYSKELLNSGIRGMIGYNYGRGRYYGMGDLDLSSDGLGIFRGDVIPGWRDFKFPGLSERNTPSSGIKRLDVFKSQHHPNEGGTEGFSEFIRNVGLKLHMKSFNIGQNVYSRKSRYNTLYDKNRKRVIKKNRIGTMSGVIGTVTSPLALAFANYNNDNRILRSIDHLNKMGVIKTDSLGYIDMYKEDYDKLNPRLKKIVDKYMKMINQHEFKHVDHLKMMRESYAKQVPRKNGLDN